MRRHPKASSAGPTANRHRGRGALIAAALALVLLGIAAAPAVAAPPTVTIDPTPTASYTTAHVTGKVNPEDNEVLPFFEYSAHPEIEGWSFGAFLPTLAPNSGEASVSDDLAGLRPGTKYFVRLVAINFTTPEPEVISAEPNPTFTTEAVPPPSVTIMAPGAVTGTTAHFSGQINPEAPAGNPPAFNVPWHFQCNPECPSLANRTVDGTPSEEVAADNSSHEVAADATNLKPATSYEVTLVAANANGPVSAGPEFFTTDPVLPEIIDAGAAPSATEANFNARINPGGAETTYHFEYGPSASYGQSTPSRTLPAGLSVATVSAHVSSLSAASGYHLRVVAENSAGTVEGPDHTFATTSAPGSESDSCPNAAIRADQGASWLSDCRAYERVTPADNGGVPPFPGNQQGRFRATADGEKVVYSTQLATYPSAAANPSLPLALATRNAAVWQVEPISKPTSGALAYAGVVGRTISSFSNDMSRMVVVSSRSLGGQGVDGNGNIYIYDSNTGRYTLVTTEPNRFNDLASTSAEYRWIGGSADLRTIAFELDQTNVFLWSEGTGLRSLGPGWPTFPTGQKDLEIFGGVSEDGSRIYYRENTTGAAVLDENGTKTVISVSRRAGDGPDPVAACPETASPDGRYLFFSAAPLTEDAAPGTDLYRYDADSGGLEYLTNLSSEVFGTTTGCLGSLLPGIVKGWPERNEAYFLAASSGNPFQAGENLYHLDGTKVTLAVKDFQVPVEGSFALVPPLLSASPDGRYISFQSPRNLTSYDSHGQAEIYLYDGQAETLSCVSCRSDGAAPTGGAHAVDPAIGSTGEDKHIALTTTDDGTVFFDTPDPLVAADVNGTRDVYAYRNGRLSLISPGNQPYDAQFAEVTPSGRDVFFTTSQRLVASDRDDVRDIYDARIEGGIAAQNVTPPVPCRGDACRGDSPAAPSALNASSEAPQSSGVHHRIARQHCGKDRRRQKQKGKPRCVKRHKKQGKGQAKNRRQGR